MELAGTVRPLAPSSGCMWLTVTRSDLIPSCLAGECGDSVRVTISPWLSVSLTGALTSFQMS